MSNAFEFTENEKDDPIYIPGSVNDNDADINETFKVPFSAITSSILPSKVLEVCCLFSSLLEL